MEEKKNGLSQKEKRTLMIVSLVIVLALVFGISYAYFLAQDQSEAQTITTQNIGLEFNDDTPIVQATGIKPVVREEIQTKATKKTFTVTNTGDEKMFVDISLENIVLPSALKRYDFMYALYEVDGGTEKNISNGTFEEYVGDSVKVGQYQVFEVDEAKTYNLYIWIEETNLNQNSMMGQKFSANIVVTGDVYWESPEEDFIVDGTGKITSYLGEGGEVSIPRTVNGTIVTSIGNMICNDPESDGTCNSYNKISTLIIPNTVTSIGMDAFYNYDADVSCELSNISIPNSITEIGDSSFLNNQLTNINIPNSVIKIDSYAFEGNQLTSVIIPNNISKIEEDSFYKDQLTSIIIPNGVSTINKRAFGDNQLTNVVISNSVTYIGESAFQNNLLTNLTIPSNVINIDKGAFDNNKLESLNISNGVTEIGLGAFSQNNLKKILIPSSVNTIGQSAFLGNQLTNVTISNGVTSIGGMAFYVNKLTNITIPNSVTEIGNLVFGENENLSSITIKRANSDGMTLGENWYGSCPEGNIVYQP